MRWTIRSAWRRSGKVKCTYIAAARPKCDRGDASCRAGPSARLSTLLTGCFARSTAHPVLQEWPTHADPTGHPAPRQDQNGPLLRWPLPTTVQSKCAQSPKQRCGLCQCAGRASSVRCSGDSGTHHVIRKRTVQRGGRNECGLTGGGVQRIEKPNSTPVHADSAPECLLLVHGGRISDRKAASHVQPATHPTTGTRMERRCQLSDNSHLGLH